MNIGRYLRGEDRHVGAVSVRKEKQQNTLDIDPLDTPLPCDIKIGHITIKKGVPLRSLVSRVKVLYDIAHQQPFAVIEVKEEK